MRRDMEQDKGKKKKIAEQGKLWYTRREKVGDKRVAPTNGNQKGRGRFLR